MEVVVCGRGDRLVDFWLMVAGGRAVGGGWWGGLLAAVLVFPMMAGRAARIGECIGVVECFRHVVEQDCNRLLLFVSFGFLVIYYIV